MSFETVSRDTHSRGKPVLSIYSGYQSRFSATAVREWFTDAEAVTFLVDREEDRLGIKMGKTDDSYPLGGKDGGSVCTTSFVREFGLNPDDIESAIVLPLEEDEESELIVADATPIRDRAEEKRLRELPAEYGISRSLTEICDAVEQYDSNVQIKTRIGAGNIQTVRRLLAELGLGPEGGDQPYDGEQLEQRLEELREVADA